MQNSEGHRGRCAKHDFVIPSFDDYPICADWVPNWNAGGTHGFAEGLEKGYLYRWDLYTRPDPSPIGRFEEITEFLLDRLWSLYENPDHGWSVQLAPWDHGLFPKLGETFRVKLDSDFVPFHVREAAITTTYTRRLPNRELHMEDRTEVKRVILPSSGNEPELFKWVERHFDLPKARVQKEASLRNPKHLYKDKVLTVWIQIVGKPDKQEYEFLRSPLASLAESAR